MTSTKGSIWRYSFAAALSAGIMFAATEEATAAWELVVYAVVGVAALLSMRLRYRYPLALSLILSAVAAVVPIAGICGAWAYLSLCAQRHWWKTVIGGVALAGFAVLNGLVVTPEAMSGVGALFATLFTLVFVFLLTAWGSFLGARREARQAVADRLTALEREREARVEAARTEERARLAREMHDVLAHKISLIAMHAGALAYREDLQPAELRAAAGTIQTSAHQALTELRTILGQLRQVDDGGRPAPPQPTLADLEALLAEHREVGRRIDAEVELDGAPSDAVGRHGFRIVQECLTNAARHAPNTRVRVRLSGSARDGLTISVANPLPVVKVASPGSGLGLIGLEERVQVLGGRMTAGPNGQDFRVEVWLPW